jgi:hypothetical protein
MESRHRRVVMNIFVRRFQPWSNDLLRTTSRPASKYLLCDGETPIAHALQDESEHIVNAWLGEFAQYTADTTEIAALQPGDPRAEPLLRVIQAFIARATTHLATQSSCAIPRWSHAASLANYEAARRLLGTDAAVAFQPIWEPLR